MSDSASYQAAFDADHVGKEQAEKNQQNGTSNLTDNPQPRMQIGDMGTEVRSSDLQPSRGNIMDTAQTPSGAPLPGRPLHDNDTVEVDGMRTEARFAATVGALERMPDGSFRVPTGGAGDSPETPPVAPAGNGGDDGDDDEQRRDALVHEMPESAEEAATELTNSVPPGQLGLALEAFMDGGEISAEMVERMSQSSGIDPETTTGHLAEVVRGFDEVIRGLALAEGVKDVPAFNAYARSNFELAKEAMKELAYAGTGSRFRQIAKDYVKNRQKKA